jgi:hypothetical protein
MRKIDQQADTSPAQGSRSRFPCLIAEPQVLWRPVRCLPGVQPPLTGGIEVRPDFEDFFWSQQQVEPHVAN